MSEIIASEFTDICIVTSVSIEFKTAASLLSGRTYSQESRMKICHGSFGARQITILQSEIGALSFAKRLDEHLAGNRYDALIVVGLAGGLDPKLRVGDAVLYDHCYDARGIDLSVRDRSIYKQATSIASDARLSDYLYSALNRTDSSRPGTFSHAPGITVSRIITESDDKSTFHLNFGAAAVDMETYEVFSVCSRFNLPAAALRVISDEARYNLPDFNRAYSADGRMHGGRMVATMLVRPLATFRFLMTLRRALQSLRVNLAVAMSV